MSKNAMTKQVMYLSEHPLYMYWMMHVITICNSLGMNRWFAVHFITMNC